MAYGRNEARSFLESLDPHDAGEELQIIPSDTVVQSHQTVYFYCKIELEAQNGQELAPLCDDSSCTLKYNRAGMHSHKCLEMDPAKK
jgi:hypothetical protein